MRLPPAFPSPPAVAALAALVLATPAAAGVVCPESWVVLHGTLQFTTTAGVFEYSDSDCHAGADLPQGTVNMSQPGFLAATTVEALDAYDVVGVPPGTPVNLTAQFVVDGSVSTPGCGGSGCGGYVKIRLAHEADGDSITYSIHLFQGSQSFHDVRSLPLTIVAGSPEVLRFLLSGARTPGGAHASEGRGTILFTGLPEGVDVVSCQGYSLAATPVHGTSWGSLKTIYR
jgi:hypothetical protein